MEKEKEQWVQYAPLGEQSSEIPRWVEQTHFLSLINGMEWLILAVGIVIVGVAIFWRSYVLGIIGGITAGIGCIGLLRMAFHPDYITKRPDFFKPDGGSEPLLFQNVLWFFGSPEVYLIIPKILLFLIGINWAIQSLVRRRIYSGVVVFLVATISFIGAYTLTIYKAYQVYVGGYYSEEWTHYSIVIQIGNVLALLVLVVGCIHILQSKKIVFSKSNSD